MAVKLAFVQKRARTRTASANLSLPQVYQLLICLNCHPTEKQTTKVRFSDGISAKATLQSLRLDNLGLGLYELAKEWSKHLIVTKGKPSCSLRNLELWSIDRTELNNPERYG